MGVNMESIKQILENNNIQLDLPDKILNLKFEGYFEFTEVFLKNPTDAELGTERAHQNILCWGFKDEKTGKKLFIIPDDSEWMVELAYEEDSTNYGWFITFDENADISIKEPDYTDQWYYDRMKGDKV